MYTIKQASLRTGVSVPLLRAWERRYGIPTPARTESGYRLYDEATLDRVRRLRGMVESGWSPSQAAHALIEGTAPEEPAAAGAGAAAARTAGVGVDAQAAATVAGGTGGRTGSREFEGRFVDAARRLDAAGLEGLLVEAVASVGVDAAIDAYMLPALTAVGDEWSAGELDVAAEHAASSAVLRRLGALYDAAGRPSSEPEVVVGLPPGSRHEAGALAFAVACRRAGLAVLYLGADVPLESWVATAAEHPRAAIVLGAVTDAEAESAARVAAALHAARPEQLVAVGGDARDGARVTPNGLLLLPDDLREAAATMRTAIASRR